MKVKQIVGEHKKGFRAKKYTTKPQPYIEPVKPQKPKEVSEDATITKSDASGVEITDQSGIKTTIPSDKSSAIMPDPDKPGEYDLNQTALASGSAPGAPAQPEGPKVGSKVEIKTSEASEESLGTMPTTEYVKGIYAAAAENGMDAPEVEAVKKQMVLAPNGEVDLMKTMQKALQVFQSPEWKQMLADLDALVKKAEAQSQANPELARIQELAGTANLNTSSRKAASITQAPDGSYTVTYLRAPLSVSGTPEEGKIPPPQTGIKDLATAQRIVASIEKEEDAAMSLPSSIQVADEPTQEEVQDMGNGTRKEVNPDGSYVISSGSGREEYSADGKLLKQRSPSFSGLSREKDMTTGHETDRYSAGPVSASQTRDAAGKVINTKARYDTGMGVLGGEQEKGITTKSWTPTSAEFDPVSNKDLYALGNKDKEATYDRAMKQVQGVKESAELEAMLRIAGLR